ncbi:MAG: hypothetical protein EBR82_24415 [Caulobacteraceae bacterium]|nr:hypothetical protein [Caulobacteraceae bacterium]
MKKQTAIEWLLQAIEGKNGKEFSSYYLEFIEQAKAMEMEQKVEAYSHGWHDGQDVILQQVKHIDKGGDDAGQKLYNETYGGDK